MNTKIDTKIKKVKLTEEQRLQQNQERWSKMRKLAKSIAKQSGIKVVHEKKVEKETYDY